MVTKEYDDYAWSDYTPTYMDTHDDRHGYVHFLNDGDFEIANGAITFKAQICGNIQQLIHQILVNRHSVKSVYECGCGAGWNSANVLKVFPDLDVAGSDINGQQIEYGRKHFKDHGYTCLTGFHDRLSVVDMSAEDAPSKVGRTFDIVFCQAVIMHLADHRAVQFIKNMMALSNRFIMICENSAWQNFPVLFQGAGIRKSFQMTVTTGPFAQGMYWFEKTSSPV